VSVSVLPHTLLGRSAEELEQWAVAQGQPAFRGRQLHDWLYAKGAENLGAITVRAIDPDVERMLRPYRNPVVA